jgi:outer membrane protein assembly factor BamB
MFRCFLILLAGLALGNDLHAQLRTQWSRFAEDSVCPAKPQFPPDYFCHGLTVDSAGSVIVASAPMDVNGNFKITKFAADGNPVFATTILDSLRAHGQPSFVDRTIALFTGRSGQIYCVATTGSGILWTRLSASGAILQQQSFPCRIYAWKAAIDSIGNVYYMETDYSDSFTVSRISHDGFLSYRNHYAADGQHPDFDSYPFYSHGSIFCGGFTRKSNTDLYHIYRFSADSGKLMWQRSGPDWFNMQFADDGQAIYCGLGYYLRKLSYDGDLIWRRNFMFDSALNHLNIGFHKVLLDDSANIYTSGMAEGATIFKLDSSGNLLGSRMVPRIPGPIVYPDDIIYSKGSLYAYYTSTDGAGANHGITLFRLDHGLNIIDTLILPLRPDISEQVIFHTATDNKGNLYLAMLAGLVNPDTAIYNPAASVLCMKICAGTSCNALGITHPPLAASGPAAGFFVYPNPNTDGVIQMSIDLEEAGDMQASIWDCVGRCVMHPVKISGNKGRRQVELDIRHLALCTGAYSIVLTTASGSYHSKLILL